MTLTDDQLKTLIHGAYRYGESNGYLTMTRFSDAQIEYLSFREDFYRIAKHYTPSVTAEFETDAERIGFAYSFLVQGTTDSIDVYADGALVDLKATKDLPIEGQLSFELPKGSKRVVVYFPECIGFSLKDFTIEGGWRPCRENKTKCLWIGDSITQGYGAFFAGETYVNVANRALGYDVLNQGIGGFYYDENVLTEMDGYRPDKIIVALGTNQHKSVDRKERAARFYARLTALYPHVPILCITPLWRSDLGSSMTELKAFSQEIVAVASRYPQIKLADGLRLIPHEEAYFFDRLHPNASGMAVMAENLVALIRQLGF